MQLTTKDTNRWRQFLRLGTQQYNFYLIVNVLGYCVDYTLLRNASNLLRFVKLVTQQHHTSVICKDFCALCANDFLLFGYV